MLRLRSVSLTRCTCQAHAAFCACTVRVTLLRNPARGARVHSIADEPRLRCGTREPTSGDQPVVPSAARQRRIRRKSPSSAGPGRNWLIRVAPWRIANNAPPGVTCAISPDRDFSSANPKSDAFLSLEVVDGREESRRLVAVGPSSNGRTSSGAGTEGVIARIDETIVQWD